MVLPDAATEAQLDEILGIYRGAGVEKCLIQLSPLAIPADLPDWIAARRGYTVVPTIKIVRRLTLDETIPCAALDIRDLGPDEVHQFEQIVGPRLGVPAGLEPGISSTVGRPDWRYYLVVDDQVPIAAASFVQGRHVWLGLAATCENHRRRGAQSSLLARRLEDAARAGCEWASADTSVPTAERPNQSLVNMLRLGFEVLYERVNYVVPL